MKFKFPAAIYFISAFLAGFLLVQSPNKVICLAVPAIEDINQQYINQLKQHDVVYLGENHARLEHHARQLEIITQLYQAQTKPETQLAIGLEMFQRPFQPMLNRYLTGQISESELRKQTEYDTRWGFDWEFYAPILRFAQEQRISLIALNTPAEITRKVAKTGINSLEDRDYRYIPSREAIKLDNHQYHQKMGLIYQSHLADRQGNSIDRENFFAAQVLWDETMADAISHYYQNHPQSQIVVLVGKAHVINDYAIPDRVSRRITDNSFTQTTILLAE